MGDTTSIKTHAENNAIVVYVRMGVNLHQIFYRQILRVTDRTALRWVVCCHQSDYYL